MNDLNNELESSKIQMQKTEICLEKKDKELKELQEKYEKVDKLKAEREHLQSLIITKNEMISHLEAELERCNSQVAFWKDHKEDHSETINMKIKLREKENKALKK